MSINVNERMTWADLATLCYNAMISVCCNIGAYASNVPARLKDGNGGAVTVKSWGGIGIAGSGAKWTAYWYGNGSNLIKIVQASDVSREWSEFLSEAGIDIRSNKVIQAKDTGLAVGLYQQFLAYHLKPVYSIRQVYVTTESQNLFQGIKYVTGVCTPKYKLTPVEPGSAEPVTDADIENIVNQSIFRPGVDWGMLNSTGDPNISRSYLS